jgi:hypothetical protein
VETGLPDIVGSSVSWGDYDNDGDLDVLFTGIVEFEEEIDNSGGGITQTFKMLPYVGIFRNDGGAFTEIEHDLPLAVHGEWIDYDNDGDLDVLLNGSEIVENAGVQSADTFLKLIRNDDGEFSEVVADLQGIWNGDIEIGDVDADGDLDIIVSGFIEEDGTVRTGTLWHRNDATTPNSAPSAPGRLDATFAEDVLRLEWSEGFDAETPLEGLSYNVRVGTRPGSEDVVSPMANPEGVRLIPRPGNAGQSRIWKIHGLDPGRTYFWSVQSVDQGLSGSSFSPEHIVQARSTSVQNEGELPGSPVLGLNYPNPFNPSTSIPFELPEVTSVRLVVVDLLGTEIAVLVDGQRTGRQVATWNGRDRNGTPVASGTYFVRLETPGQILTRKVLLIK